MEKSAWRMLPKKWYAVMVAPLLRMTILPGCLMPAFGTSAALNLPSANAAEAASSAAAAITLFIGNAAERPIRRYDSAMRSRPLAALFFLAACTMSSPPSPPPPQSAAATDAAASQIVFTGGIVVAGPSQTPQKGWSVVGSGERLIAAGPANEIRVSHPEARVIDVTGTTLLPGLTDAHGHLYGLGLSLDTVNLVGLESYEAAIARVKERAQRAQPGEWILGRGWDQNRWPGKQFPTAAPLDAAIPDHPVWVRRVDGHAGLANSAAMRAARVTASTPDPPGGRIIRDANGNPTGVFVDAAQELIDRAVPPPSFALRKQRILAAAQKIAEHGLTEIHDPGADDETIRAVRVLIDEKRFPIRVYTMVSDNARALTEWFARGKLMDYGERLTVRSVKLYADGALGSRGALLLAPYSDDPGNSGLVVSTVEHLTDIARRAKTAGFQVNTHAIGDRGVRNVIDAYEAAGVTPQDRFRIEH